MEIIVIGVECKMLDKVSLFPLLFPCALALEILSMIDQLIYFLSISQIYCV